MAVKQIKSGRWQAYVYDPATKTKRYISVHATRDEAEAAVATHRSDLKNGVFRRCPGCRKMFKPLDEWQKRCSFACEQRIKQRIRRRRRRIENVHWMYTCLDDTMRVIYVGITSSGIRRHREHAREAAWWKRVAFMRVEHFTTRADLEAAESAAIDFHQPIYNTIGVVLDAPDEAAA